MWINSISKISQSALFISALFFMINHNRNEHTVKFALCCGVYTVKHLGQYFIKLYLIGLQNSRNQNP